MKKALKIIGIVLCCIIMICGIYLSCRDNTKDFSGTITQISNEDEYTVLMIDDAFNNSYIILANLQTKIRHVYKEDGDITLSELKIGDKIQGDYKKLSSKDNCAKLIEVI